MSTEEIARSVVLPPHFIYRDVPAVHVHAVYRPTSSRFWIATISNYLPGDRMSEQEFLTVLCDGYMPALRDGGNVARAINQHHGRPSRYTQ